MNIDLTEKKEKQKKKQPKSIPKVAVFVVCGVDLWFPKAVWWGGRLTQRPPPGTWWVHVSRLPASLRRLLFLQLPPLPGRTINLSNVGTCTRGHLAKSLFIEARGTADWCSQSMRWTLFPVLLPAANSSGSCLVLQTYWTRILELSAERGVPCRAHTGLPGPHGVPTVLTGRPRLWWVTCPNSRWSDSKVYILCY